MLWVEVHHVFILLFDEQVAVLHGVMYGSLFKIWLLKAVRNYIFDICFPQGRRFTVGGFFTVELPVSAFI